jgi:predicted ATPase
MSKTPLKDFTDAAKLDVLETLKTNEPGVFEWRRAQTIAAQMIDLCNSYGSPVEHGAIAQAIRMAETGAPNLHDVLLGRAFDGDGLLTQKYEEMLKQHTELRHAALNIADARAEVSRDRVAVEATKAEVKAAHEQLAIERERLQLQADAAGKSVNLPTLPKLTRPEDEEDVDPDEGQEVDLNEVAAKRDATGTWGVGRGEGGED